MGLPMYVSPSIPKRQLPSKQPTSPPYTPQTEESYDETFQNGRTNVFDIPESQTESSQRSQRSRRSSSLPYNLVQQHIHRLHQLHQLHRTREQQQHISPNLASRRGLNSVHHLSLNHRSQIQHLQQMQMAAQARRENNFDNSRNFREERLDDSHDEMFDLSFDDFVTSLDNNNNYNFGDVQNDNNNNSNNNNNNNTSSSSNSSSNSSNNNNDNNNNNNNSNHHHHHHHHRSSNSSSVALDNVIRRVNLLRQISQQQEIRSMRSSSRHHRSSTGHSSGRSSRITSQNTNVDRRRDDLIQRGIDIHPSRHPIPDSNLLYEHNVPFPPVQRLSAWHTRRGVNWSTVDPPPVQRTERRSSFADDFYSTSEIPHQYESDVHHLSRIISPIPRRYDSRFAISSLPIGNDHGLLLENNNNNSSSNNRSSNNDSIGTGSAAGGVC